MKTVKFYTLGCKVNSYETAAMEELFRGKGYTVTEEEKADVIVVNTCTVTGTGAQKSRQMVRRARRLNPDAVVAMVGCLPQAEPEEAYRIEEADIIAGTSDKGRIVELVEEYRGKKLHCVCAPSDSFEPLRAVRQEQTRAVLKIEDGCTNFCSYCMIPYARGKVRSKPLAEVAEEAAAQAAQGYTEIVLTGIHLGSYGRDTGDTLLDAIRAVHEVEGIKRIRLGSLEPRTVDEAFVKAIADLPKVCPHLHLSLQSGSDSVLKRMNRRYTAKEYLEACERAREIPSMSITTDLIVGFPGETEEELVESLLFAETAGLTRMHIFPYSKRKGTPAATMQGQIPKAEKERRARIAKKTSDRLAYEFHYDMLEEEAEVLFEETKDGIARGYTANYVRVAVPCEEALTGEYRTVRLLHATPEEIEGELI